MIRRRKFQINPNIGAVKTEKPELVAENVPTQLPPPTPAVEETSKQSKISRINIAPEEPLVQQAAIAPEVTIVTNEDNDESNMEIDVETVDSSLPSDPIPSTSTASIIETESLSASRSIHKAKISDAMRLCDSTSVADNETIASDDDMLSMKSGSTRGRRSSYSRRRLGEELDTKKFTLADLINWRPSTENTLRRKWDEKRRQMLENMSQESIDGFTLETKQPAESIGPRVKINEKGEMIIDEQSLVVVENGENNTWETVDDELMPKKLNSMSFRKFRRTTLWSAYETDLFYEVLSATGTDFGLMHEYIPNRTRAELKKKFNREEKVDPERLNEVLQKPTLLDDTLNERVCKLTGKVQEEQMKKEAQKRKGKKIC
ncbi:myb DNA-binding like domain-containing protein [Ditylenchus destructor]|uniref:Myb DNA-binding like domain-containing protein n=1 Tax=Ditylenchus destructor TaxID=166010 RepID=A0AAD4NF35_9BILA|nr:myb DNA-binding like domain-containing protein [Ditylenchus destructor]